MDNLVNAASSFVQQQVQQGGQNESQDNQKQDQGHGFDIGSLVSAASSRQSGSTDSNQFAQIASSLLSNHANIASGDQPSPEAMKDANNAVEGNNKVDSNQIGASAAIKAVQTVLGSANSGNSGSGQGQGQQGGGNLQSKLMGAAMAHAADIFESKQAQGLIDKASKNEAVQHAGEYVMKMVMKQQLKSQGGDLGALAAQFIK